MHAKTGLDVADVHPVRAGPDEQPVDIQPGRVAQLGQALCCEFAVHGFSVQERIFKRNYIPSYIDIIDVSCATRRLHMLYRKMADVQFTGAKADFQ
jgi:hypothetical protein